MRRKYASMCASTFIEYVVLAIAITTSLIIMSKWARKFIIGRAREAVKSTWGEISDTGNVIKTVPNGLTIVVSNN